MRKGLLLALVIIMSYYGCTKKIITEGAADITSQDETSVNAVSNADGKAEIIKGNSITESGINRCCESYWNI
jgi:hypothetical protein